MSVHVIFIIGRTNYYRLLSPMIHEGLERGHRIECWHDYTHRQNKNKGYLFPDIEMSPFYSDKYENLQFRKILKKKDYDNFLLNCEKKVVIVSIIPAFLLPISRKILEKPDLVWCLLNDSSTSYSQMLMIESKKFSYDHKWYFFTYNNSFHDEGMKFLKIEDQNVNKYFLGENVKIVPVGSALMGKRNSLSNMDKKFIRMKYNIPENKDILIYLPYPFSPGRKEKNGDLALQAAYSGLFIESKYFLKKKHKSNNIYQNEKRRISYLKQIVKNKEALRFLFKGYNEIRVFRSVKKFCKKNDLYLVVKPRIKFPFPGYIRRNADIVIPDDESQQYPTKLQELFSISKLTIGMLSTAVMESIYYNVPYINIERLNIMSEEPRIEYWHPTHEGSRFAFKGASTKMSIKEMIYDFPKKSIGEFEMNKYAREKYLNLYLGCNDAETPKRIYNYIEEKILG